MESKSKVKKILDELNFDFRSFTMKNFIDWIEKKKRREIILIPWKMPVGLFGAWMSDGDGPREYVFYRNSGPQIHQIHIQLHEISHYLCGHPTKIITRESLYESRTGVRELPFNDLTKLRSPELNHDEFEAEYLASLIQEQVIRHSHLHQLTSRISSDEKIAGYLRDLGLT